MIASGLLSAALFLFMSHARPLVTLAPRRPPATIVCTYMAFTVFAQVSHVAAAARSTPPDLKPRHRNQKCHADWQAVSAASRRRVLPASE